MPVPVQGDVFYRHYQEMLSYFGKMGKDLSISIAGCQANGNIIRNGIETSVVLYLEFGLPRQRCTLKS